MDVEDVESLAIMESGSKETNSLDGGFWRHVSDSLKSHYRVLQLAWYGKLIFFQFIGDSILTTILV